MDSVGFVIPIMRDAPFEFDVRAAHFRYRGMGYFRIEVRGVHFEDRKRLKLVAEELRWAADIIEGRNSRNA